MIQVSIRRSKKPQWLKGILECETIESDFLRESGALNAWSESFTRPVGYNNGHTLWQSCTEFFQLDAAGNSVLVTTRSTYFVTNVGGLLVNGSFQSLGRAQHFLARIPHATVSHFVRRSKVIRARYGYLLWHLAEMRVDLRGNQPLLENIVTEEFAVQSPDGGFEVLKVASSDEAIAALIERTRDPPAPSTGTRPAP